MASKFYEGAKSFLNNPTQGIQNKAKSAIDTFNDNLTKAKLKQDVKLAEIEQKKADDGVAALGDVDENSEEYKAAVARVDAADKALQEKRSALTDHVNTMQAKKNGTINREQPDVDSDELFKENKDLDHAASEEEAQEGAKELGGGGKFDEKTGKEDTKANANNSVNSGNAEGKDTRTAGQHSAVLSGDFYDNISNAVPGMLANMNKGKQVTDPNYNAEKDILSTKAAQQDMASQQAMQKANENEYARASKAAIAEGKSQSDQKAANAKFAGGAAAASAKRIVAQGNVQQEVARKDEQAAKGQELQEMARDTEQQINRTDAEQRKGNYEYNQMQANNNTAGALSMGQPAGGDEETPQPEAPKPPEQQPATPPAEEPPQDPPPSDWQSVLNYLTYGNDPTSQWYGGDTSQIDPKVAQRVSANSRLADAKQYAENHGWQPISEQDSQGLWKYPTEQVSGKLQTIVEQKIPDFSKAWRAGSQRFKEDGTQINATTKEGIEEFHKAQTQ